MKVFDRADSKIYKLDDSVGIYLPLEYIALEGFDAQLSAAVDNDDLIFVIKPDIRWAVRETVNELWRDLRILFSKISDIGEKVPWEDIEIIWQMRHEYEDKVPISAAEVLEHRRIRSQRTIAWNKEDMRKSIHDTFSKLCTLASRNLGFKDKVFYQGFADGVANKFSLISCTYGVYDVLCWIFSEEFNKVNDDRYWVLTSEQAQKAVAAAYKKIKFLESNPEEFQKERARVQKVWGFPLQASI